MQEEDLRRHSPLKKWRSCLSFVEVRLVGTETRCAQSEVDELSTTLGSASDRNWKKLQGYDKLDSPDQTIVENAIKALLGETTSKPKPPRIAEITEIDDDDGSIRSGDSTGEYIDIADVMKKLVEMEDLQRKTVLDVAKILDVCFGVRDILNPRGRTFSRV
jgi:hypothetical protein